MFFDFIVVVVILAVICGAYIVYLSTKGTCEKCGTCFQWRDGVVFGTNNNSTLHGIKWQRDGNMATKYESYKKFWENTCKSCGHKNICICFDDRTPYTVVEGSSIAVLDCPMCNGKGESLIRIDYKEGTLTCGFCDGQKWVPKDKVHSLFHNKIL